MSRFQLCTRDEYGQAAILMTSEDLEEVQAEMRKQVNSSNVDNALTVDDKKRNWSAYWVLPLKEGYIYAEKNVQRKDILCQIGKIVEKAKSATPQKKPVEGEIRVAETTSDPKASFSSKTVLLSDVKSDIRIVLGTLDNRLWYAEDARGNVIDSLEHPDLEAKTVYFIRTV